jgi:DNA-directed RNA polymerase subunit F
MSITPEIKKEIKDIFEKPEYYGRELSKEEVEEIAEHLADFAEVAVDYLKTKNY